MTQQSKQPKKWMGSTPTTCDLCKRPFGTAFVDGRTAWGPWAMMCDSCHRDNGGQLGLGRGQRYNLGTLVKVGG